MNELGGRQRVQAHYEEPVTNWERTQARREIHRQPQPSVEANLQMQTGESLQYYSHYKLNLVKHETSLSPKC